MKQMFISYSRLDRARVDEIVQRLPGLGYQAWIDSSLHGGQAWWDEILGRIADCDAFVAIVSRSWLESKACQRELEWALALNKPVLPVALEPVTRAMPSVISKRQIVDYSQPSQDAAYSLFGALNALPPAPPRPEVLPKAPEIPLSYLSDLVDRVAKETLTHDEQREVVNELQPALMSTDPEEREGAQTILDRFARRDDLYADIYRMLADVARLGAQNATAAPLSSPRIPLQGIPLAGMPTGPAPAQGYGNGYGNGYGYAGGPQPPMPATALPKAAKGKRPSAIIWALIGVFLLASSCVAVVLIGNRKGDSSKAAGSVVGNPIQVGSGPLDAIFANGFLWTANSDDGTVSKIDTDQATSTAFDVGGNPSLLSASEQRLWVHNFRDAVTPFDINTGNSYNEIPTGPSEIRGMAVWNGSVWVSHADNTVTRLDEGNGDPVGAPIVTGDNPRQFAIGHDFLYLVTSGDQSVVAFKPNGEIAGAVQVPNASGAIEYSDGTIYVWTTEEATDSIVPVDEATFASGQPIDVTGAGCFMPDGKGIWIAFPAKNELHYFDHNGVESKGGPIEGIGKGITEIVPVGGNLWLVDHDNDSVVRVKVN
jgi:hypothetical protein